jgi:magnesium chelatase accessory protein
LALRAAQIMPVGRVIGINAALSKFDGVAGWVFPIMAKVLAMTPLVATVFSKYAGTPSQVRQLLTATGSRIDREGEAQYLHLLRMISHVDATLSMMAQWDLGALMDSLPAQTTPCLLITAAGDRAVPSSVSQKAATAMPQARWVDLPLYGHLVHEEAADKVAALILGFLTSLEKPAA